MKEDKEKKAGGRGQSALFVRAKKIKLLYLHVRRERQKYACNTLILYYRDDCPRELLSSPQHQLSPFKIQCIFICTGVYF
jgi:hypothetical protein